MLTLRKASDRFHTQIDWLDSWHTFSFGHHYDPNHMAFGPLRVINDDRVKGGGGFDTHPHRDMEIITVVLSGALAHKDSLGTGSVIVPGDVQKMSAGTGIRHSEFNASQTDPVHLLQIWIIPDKEGVKPAYQQISVKPSTLRDRWGLVASPDGAEGSISLYQDAKLFIADVTPGKAVSYTPPKGRSVFVHAALGGGTLNNIGISAGDGIGAVAEKSLTFTASSESKILLFDLQEEAA